jgi:hypothetical protein
MMMSLEKALEKEKSRRLKRCSNGKPKSRTPSIASSVGQQSDTSNHATSPVSVGSATKKFKVEEPVKPPVSIQPKDLLNEFLDAGVEEPKLSESVVPIRSSQNSSHLSEVPEVNDDEEYEMNSEDDRICSFRFSPEKASQSSQPKTTLLQDDVNGKETSHMKEKPMDAVGEFFLCSGKKVVTKSQDLQKDLFKNIDV